MCVCVCVREREREKERERERGDGVLAPDDDFGRIFLCVLRCVCVRERERERERGREVTVSWRRMTILVEFLEHMYVRAREREGGREGGRGRES